MVQDSPSRFADKFMVRFPEGMRERLAAAARANRRSMNAELIVHLETALAAFNAQPAKPSTASN